MIQNFVLYMTLGIVLHTVEITVFHWAFWAVLALLWAAQIIVRYQTRELAMVEGITAYLNMSSDQQSEIKRIFNKHTNDQHHG